MEAPRDTWRQKPKERRHQDASLQNSAAQLFEARMLRLQGKDY